MVPPTERAAYAIHSMINFLLRVHNPLVGDDLTGGRRHLQGGRSICRRRLPSRSVCGRKLAGWGVGPRNPKRHPSPRQPSIQRRRPRLCFSVLGAAEPAVAATAPPAVWSGTCGMFPMCCVLGCTTAVRWFTVCVRAVCGDRVPNPGQNRISFRSKLLLNVTVNKQISMLNSATSCRLGSAQNLLNKQISMLSNILHILATIKASPFVSCLPTSSPFRQVVIFSPANSK